MSQAIVYLQPQSPEYPVSLQNWNISLPIASLGNREILQRKKLAFFCSQKCPGSIILKTYDLVQEWNNQGITVVSGFHSPMEREALNLLLPGLKPMILCPARSIENMRLPKEYQKLVETGRMLILSPFSERQKRKTTELALERNRFVAALADTIFIAYAEPQGKIESLCKEAMLRQKLIYTFAGNDNLLALGAKSEN